MSLKENMKIKKRKVKIRHGWVITPFTRVFKSKKDYNRTKDKINLKRSHHERD